jgi:cGMP-dependent protein kinase 1
MGGGASTSKEQKIPEKIPEMPAEIQSPNSPENISLLRSRSGLTDVDTTTPAAKNARGRRRSSVTSSSNSKDVFNIDKLMQTPVSPKLTEDTKKLVVESIQHFFFPIAAENAESTTESVENKKEIELFLKALVRETSPANSFAMKEGDVATKLYILESGDVEVTIGGNFIRNMGPGSLFGELALIYNAPRSASIKCTNDCVFWVLSRTNYQGILNMTQTHDVTQRLMDCPEISNDLGYVGRSKLLKSLKMQTYEKDEVIYEQGCVMDNVMLIESGSAMITCGDSSGSAVAIVYDDLHLDSFEEDCKEKGTTREAFQLTEGYIFGIPVINAHVHAQSKGMWNYNTEEKSILCPVRVVASEKVQCAVFTIAYFESLRLLDPPMKADMESMRLILAHDDEQDGKEDFGEIRDFNIVEMKLHLITSQGSRSAHAVGIYSNQREYSIKYVSKANIISKTNKEIADFFNESDMLRTFHSRFIQKMCCVFETPTAIAFATEELDRGDLFSAIYENQMFPAEEGGIPSELIKFYTCAIASALSYLHKRNISYRDLKPENCMIDARGYIKLTEFSFAKKIPFFSKDRWGRKILQVKSTTICKCHTGVYIVFDYSTVMCLTLDLVLFYLMYVCMYGICMYGWIYLLYVRVTDASPARRNP